MSYFFIASELFHKGLNSRGDVMYKGFLYQEREDGSFWFNEGFDDEEWTLCKERTRGAIIRNTICSQLQIPNVVTYRRHPLLHPDQQDVYVFEADELKELVFLAVQNLSNGIQELMVAQDFVYLLASAAANEEWNSKHPNRSRRRFIRQTS
jgi:hypothetical protein